MTEASGATPPATVKVWDPFVRVFHWSLVSLFAIALVTGDELERLHIAAGYFIVGLLALLIVWGFVSPRHARFSDFVGSPRDAISYLRNIVWMRARRYIGHKPAGGLTMIALIVMLAATCATGYLLTTDVSWGSGAMEEALGALTYATVGLFVLHVLGVLFAGVEHRENLVKAMITGRKRAR